jgi:ABC-type glycerol-3-phosphate transport system substrate-binding protein
MATATSKRKALAISGRNLTAAQKAKQRNDAAGKFADAAVGSENAGLVMVEQFVRYLTTGATVKDTAKALGDSVKARGISNPSVYTSRAINGASVCVALGVLPSEANDVELSAIRNARLVTGPNGDQDERREDIAALVNAVRGGVAPDKALKELKASRKPAEGPEDKTEDKGSTSAPEVTPEVPEGDAFDADDFASEVSYVIAALDSMPRADVAVIRKEAQRLLTACKAVLS